VENIIHSTVHFIEKILLLEAIEWQKVKLNQYDEQMNCCNKELIIVQSFQKQEKKPNWENISVLLKEYTQYIKDKLHDTSIQQIYDDCLILFTALQTKQIQGKNWNEKTFFKQLTEQL